MFIHTIDLGNYYKINYNLTNLKIWSNNQIIELIKNKYPKILDYYNNLILINSREYLAKLLILNEYGGLYIHFNLLNDTFINEMFLVNSMTMNYDFVFWENHYQQDIIKKIYEINKNYLSNEIIFTKKTNSILFNYFINNINYNIVPKNEYENKIYLGDVFLSKKTIDFCYENNIDLDNKVYCPIIKIKSKLPIDNIKYKQNICPKIDELINPDIYFSSWENIIKGMLILQNILGLYLYSWKDYKIVLLYLLIITVINSVIIYLIRSNPHTKIYETTYDNKLFFNPDDFNIFNKIRKKWKSIAKEAKNVLDNAPKLNITRKYDEWTDSTEYINKISKEYGWIKSWKYSNDDEDKNSDSNQTNSDPQINLAWENYGLVHSKFIFKPNVEKCPKTYKLLKSIRKHINISGFSYMKPNCLLNKHTDETGLINDALAFHLGLIIPENEQTCKLVIKSPDNKLYGITEKSGKSFIFDATYEHYAYNQSSGDRIILYIDFKCDKNLKLI